MHTTVRTSKLTSMSFFKNNAIKFGKGEYALITIGTPLPNNHISSGSRPDSYVIAWVHQSLSVVNGVITNAVLSK